MIYVKVSWDLDESCNKKSINDGKSHWRQTLFASSDMLVDSSCVQHFVQCASVKMLLAKYIIKGLIWSNNG